MSFNSLVKLVQQKIIDSGGVMKMKLIVEMFTKFKQAVNESLEGLLTKNVKSRLITHFGNKLCLWALPGKGELFLVMRFLERKHLNGIWTVTKVIILKVQLKIYEKRYWIIRKHLQNGHHLLTNCVHLKCVFHQS